MTQIDKLRINVQVSEKVNLGNYESTDVSLGISLEISVDALEQNGVLTHETKQKLRAMHLKLLYEKDQMLAEQIARIRAKRTQSTDLYHHYTEDLP